MSDVSRETPASPSSPPVPWLTVVGVGDAGAASLATATLAMIRTAKVVIGSARLLYSLQDQLDPQATCHPWTSLEQTLATILDHRGTPTLVLATGDPMFFGLGSTLSRAFAEARIDNEEWTVIPSPSAFSLAAARLHWSIQDCLCLTAHGRPIEALRLHISPGQRMLILSANGQTPAQIARQMCQDGYGPSPMTVLWHMDGEKEGQWQGSADRLPPEFTCPDLNTVAIDARLAAGARPLSRLPGLDDSLFEHDGQITKQDIRALTLSALAPWPGAHLWDLGAGSGSISIEWMRAAPGATALAVERDADRVVRIGRNAHALGVPGLQILLGQMPGVLGVLDEDDHPPDAIFVGGSLSLPGLLDRLWARLPVGGRLVTNAVTVQGEAAVLAFQASHGGRLRRYSISQTRDVGPSLQRWISLAPITQLCAEKSS